MIEHLLKYYNEEQGLKTDWKDVDGAVLLLTKRQQRRDKTIVSNDVPSTFTPHKQNLERHSNMIPKNDGLNLMN